MRRFRLTVGAHTLRQLYKPYTKIMLPSHLQRIIFPLQHHNHGQTLYKTPLNPHKAFTLYQDDIAHCQEILKRYSKNYHASTLLFPKHLGEKVAVLYAFFRVPDEFVDNPVAGSCPLGLIEDFEERWQQAYNSGVSSDPVLRATAALAQQHAIPFEYFRDFLRAMKQDCHKADYANYQELQDYMYGSASCVGLILMHVLGFDKRISYQDICRDAALLGEAMQLSNFLRDIREDALERQRIYLPLDELQAFGLHKDDIFQQVVDERFRAFMQFQIERNRAQYQKANLAIPHLAKSAQRAVRIASKLYEYHLDVIENHAYDVYQKSTRISAAKRLRLVLGAL